jgi:hypothetical protein
MTRLLDRIAVADELSELAAQYARDPDPAVFARCLCKLIRLYGERSDPVHSEHISSLSIKLRSMAENHQGGVAIARFSGLVSRAYVLAGGLDLVTAHVKA